MSNMGEPTSTYSTYGQQQQTPMPPGMQPGYQPTQHTQHTSRRISRPAWAGTELLAYVLTIVGILIASAVISDSAAPGDQDHFRADQAWTLITILTFGYILSKGIAKAGKNNSVYDENSRY